EATWDPFKTATWIHEAGQGGRGHAPSTGGANPASGLSSHARSGFAAVGPAGTPGRTDNASGTGPFGTREFRGADRDGPRHPQFRRGAGPPARPPDRTVVENALHRFVRL